MAKDKSERIGTNQEFPKLTINGKPYTRPCSTIALGNGYIAVLDGYEQQKGIDELRAFVKKQTVAKTIVENK